MPQHICYVTNEIDPGTIGGIGRLINAAAHILTKAGWHITFLLATSADAAETFRVYAREHFPQARVYHVDELLDDLAGDEDVPLWGFHFHHYHQSYRIALALRKLCAQHTFDGIELNDYQGIGYVALKWRRLWGDVFQGVPMWLHLHGTLEMCLDADDARTFSREQEQLFAMERYCLRHADGWISPAAMVAQWFQNVYSGTHVPVVVAPPAFERIGAGHTHSRDLGTPPYHVLFYGKIQRLKGIDLFIEAALDLCATSSLPLHFEIVGPDVHMRFGSYQVAMERKIPAQWRDRFHFHGRIHPSELEQLAQACTLAVIPSRMETYCLAAHELNWIGIPLVLNDIPTFRDYFSDGRDCRTFDGTSADLARVLNDILSQPEPFATWTWNAPKVLAKIRGTELYDEALQFFRPFMPPAALALSPRVSVVVPYYNMQDYVEQTLESIAASTYPNWEIILVDDGSPSAAAQETFAALQQQYANDARYQFVRKPNGGLGSARNYGVTFARGEYILPLDSDDVIAPDYIAAGVQALERLPELSAVSCFVSFFLDGQPTDEIVDYVIPYDLDARLITLENRVGVACSIFRRAVFEHLRYDEALTAYEDWDFWIQFVEQGYQAETMPRILYRYRRRRDSMFHALDIARHTYLLQHIATNHAAHLQQHGDAIFRLYTARIGELQYEKVALQQQSHPSMHATVGELYREIRNTRRSRSYQVAQLVQRLATPFRRLRHPNMQYNSPAHDSRLTIEVLPSHNASSQGHEVWLVGVRQRDTSAYLLTPFRPTGGWQLKDMQHDFFDAAMVGTQPGMRLTARLSGDGFALMFLNHAWSGQIAVRVDEHVQQIDLYASESAARFQEYRWNGSRWEKSQTPWIV